MKKSISIIMCALLALSSVSLGAYALEDVGKPEVSFSGEFQAVQYDPSNKIELSPASESKGTAVFANSFYSDTDYSLAYTFYSFLTDNQKSVYDSVLSDPLLESYSVTFASPFEDDCALDDDGNLSPSDALTTELYNAIIGGLSALGEDYPEYFWLNSYYLSYSLTSDFCEITASSDSENPYHIKITGITFQCVLNTSVYSDYDTVFSLYEQLKQAVNDFEVSGNTRYEKVKSIHDGIINMVEYDSNYNNSNKNPTDHEPVSVFFSPYLTVCEGYTEAFKLLCDREGIPCVVVVGYSGSESSGHAWNYVQMDDGKWYAVDSTWDDASTSGVSYGYFLVGSDTAYGSSTTYSSKHTPTGKVWNYDGFSLTYPSLSDTSYSKAVGKTNSPLTVSKTKMRLYLTVGETLDDSVKSEYGYTVSYTSPGDTTGQAVEFTSSSDDTSEEYTLIVLGDVVANGEADSDDYEKIKAYIEGSDTELTDVQSDAADIDGDGAIDGFDLFYSDKLINGYEIN